MGLLLGAAHGVLLARRFTNRSCHAPPARITSSALSQTCLRVPQWALCFLSRECLSAHASRCPFFWHQSFRRRRPRRRAAAANFAADDDADVVALTTIALALATPPLWKAATAADTADADAAELTLINAAAARAQRQSSRYRLLGELPELETSPAKLGGESRRKSAAVRARRLRRAERLGAAGENEDPEEAARVRAAALDVLANAEMAQGDADLFDLLPRAFT